VLLAIASSSFSPISKQCLPLPESTVLLLPPRLLLLLLLIVVITRVYFLTHDPRMQVLRRPI